VKDYGNLHFSQTLQTIDKGENNERNDSKQMKEQLLILTPKTESSWNITNESYVTHRKLHHSFIGIMHQRPLNWVPTFNCYEYFQFCYRMNTNPFLFMMGMQLNAWKHGCYEPNSLNV
jgi:hypothetical protein